MKISHRLVLFPVFMILAIAVLSRCVSSNEEQKIMTHPNGQTFAGSEVCANCHKSINHSFSNTAHYFTSRPASKKYIKGTLDKNNVYEFDANKRIAVEEHRDTIWQVSYVHGKRTTAAPIDIVVGSGRKGQTYLYWKGYQIYQLPLSYYLPEKTWVNSPGFATNEIVFDRLIETRCLECHSTFFQSKYVFGISQAYDKENIIYGVSCERCHGPAQQHVNFHTQYPEEKKPKNIVSINSLSRQQQLDLCAQCHSSMGQGLKPAFSFLPGDTLSKFYVTRYNMEIDTSLDVHGNQYGLLAASKCFRLSKNMTCSSCHNTHVTERDNLAVFTNKCMNCHKENSEHFCKMVNVIGPSIKNNCIDCHMPLKASENLKVQAQGTTDLIPDIVRTHLIAIYKNGSK